MNQITGQDVGEFMEKIALDLGSIPDLRGMNLKMDENVVRKNLGQRQNYGGLDVNKVNSDLQKMQPKMPKLNLPS